MILFNFQFYGFYHTGGVIKNSVWYTCNSGGFFGFLEFFKMYFWIKFDFYLYHVFSNFCTYLRIDTKNFNLAVMNSVVNEPQTKHIKREV